MTDRARRLFIDRMSVKQRKTHISPDELSNEVCKADNKIQSQRMMEFIAVPIGSESEAETSRLLLHTSCPPGMFQSMWWRIAALSNPVFIVDVTVLYPNWKRRRILGRQGKEGYSSTAGGGRGGAPPSGSTFGTEWVELQKVESCDIFRDAKEIFCEPRGREHRKISAGNRVSTWAEKEKRSRRRIRNPAFSVLFGEKPLYIRGLLTWTVVSRHSLFPILFMASTAMRPVFLNEESLSLRSFRVNTLSNSPPSLKASSLKLKSSLAFSSLLGSRGRTTQKYPQPTLKDLTRESYEEGADNDFLLPDLSKMPHMNTNSASEVQTEQSPLARPRSKSRTIIRMLTTKFTPRTVSSPTQLVRPPPAVSNAFSKDQRDAALRERGLLPPLRPNKDLSAQELELDHRIPIVQPVEESDEQSSESGPSAADLIKKEWVAKNHGVEEEHRDRMNNFKFGGGSTPLASPSVEGQFPVPPAHEQVAGQSTADDASPPNEPLPPVPTLSERDPQEQACPAPSPPSAVLPPPPSDDQTIDRSSSPLLELSSEIQAFMFPLPPSPSPSRREIASPPRSPISVIHPSPSLRSVPGIPQSLRSDTGESGANTPRALEIQETVPLSPSQSAAPAISLTPPTAASSPATADALSSAFHMRTDSFALLEESITSVMTPSLDSTSQTTATSTTGTTDSNSNGSSAAKGPGPGKLGMLQVKTHEAATVPVIVESPIEASRFSEELAVVVEEGSASMELDEKAEDLIASTSPVPQSPPAVGSPAATLRPNKRGLTDPTANVDRRKSLNPFKRGQTITGDAGKPTSPNPGAEPQRRLSMAASLSNMRRSVVGTLSKPKAGGDGNRGRKFDASHLPPSPTIPVGSVGSRAAAASRSPPSSPRPRQAVSPVMYNRGSILLETAGIEDEESRRMTELAFLG
ncbi:hypothetical protein GALMADRAFT_209299 [Galerina marginata CBS 339.88]|uniref:Uncharacterized protein n=1 Tax=Galerina marginata (strain CBS 339.88) TaxID=685588 RepID=A0A067T733_GALM3|nr:hypothetical protein GALMADRAFT_209299 [Galerina marginata CBS 339.88]